MSREVKRVPLDFNWELKRVWEGYLLPEWLRLLPCPTCDGDGMSPETVVFNQAIIDILNGSSYEYHITQDMVDYLYQHGRLRVYFDQVPDVKEFIDHYRSSPGEWSMYRYVMIEKYCSDLSVESLCSHCQGEGQIEKWNGQRSLSDKWERIEPPAGEGWQLWETVSEGSPISPVFNDVNEFTSWLADHHHITEKQARAFIFVGWAPSFIVIDSEFRQGIDMDGDQDSPPDTPEEAGDYSEVVSTADEDKTIFEEYHVAYENDTGDVKLIGIEKNSMEEILDEMESIVRFDSGKDSFIDDDGKSYLLNEDGTREYFNNRYFIVSRSFSPWTKETRYCELQLG